MLIAYMQHFNTLHITFMHYGHRNKTKEEKKHAVIYIDQHATT